MEDYYNLLKIPAQYKRISARRGAKKAKVAVAHTIAYTS